jgi:pyridinium-3,5-bisthiocarboxylic acid mononucleotide nickel chelatase
LKILHFDIVSGIAGDMTLGALLHLGVPLDPLREAVRAMGLENISLEAKPASPNGIGAIRFQVHSGETGHEHRSWGDIRKLLGRAGLTPGARERAEDIFARLARVEGAIHGVDAQNVVFHEVGAVDSIADVVGVALALDFLGPDEISSSPTVLGHGLTKSQHGTIPIPAPATLELLKGIPARGTNLGVELTTPTGAAILASQVRRFSSWPDMILSRIGYGAGSRELEDRPNLLRVLLGEQKTEQTADEILLEANIDDMSPEYFDHLMERLLEAGAHDVWLQPVYMKKSRPAVTLSVLCNEGLLESLEKIVFTESTTIGLRRWVVTRRKLARRHETVQTAFGPVRIKVSGDGDQTMTASPEHDDCKKLAVSKKVPLKLVYEAAMQAWSGRG